MFHKTASVDTLAVASFKDGGLVKTASYEGNVDSAYLSGEKPVNIADALKIVASEYDISANPEDYIYEAIRGNTTNKPNDNNDAFHKDELLRFDHRLGKQVYRTYELKPHHINHRSENPKNARGFILDVHYNDSATSLNDCPNCGNKTASKEGRDIETGLHCNKCGQLVKDEFVELLVAIDTKKDPAFADGVSRGVLKNGSMGCSCLRTRCNICNNVAYSRSEFCKHIAKHKGKEFDEAEPEFKPIAFIISIDSNGKTAGKPRKVAKAYEWCEGVIYDEFSRVHDPADPQSEQYEVLRLNAQLLELSNSDVLRHETEMLTLQTKVAELEKIIDEKLIKVAQALPPLPVPPVPAPGAGTPPPPPGDVLPPGPLDGIGEEEEEGDTVVVNINTSGDGVEVETEGTTLEETALPGKDIAELTPEEIGATPAGPGGALTPEAMGIMPAPPPPPKRGNKTGGPSMLRFAQSYKNFKAEITSVGNIRVFDKDGTLFVVKPNNVPTDSKVAEKDGADLAKGVLKLIAQTGLGTTINQTKAIVGPRMAQVLQYYVDDMAGDDRGAEPGSILDETETDMAEKRPSAPDSTTAGGEETDRKENHDPVGEAADVLDGRETDIEDEQHDRNPNDLSVTDMKDSDMRDKRKDWNLSQSAVDDIETDHSDKTAKKECKECKCDPCECKKDKKDKKAEVDMKAHAARLEKLYENRLAKKVEDLKAKQVEFIKNHADRFARALKLVARRQALNLEYSPMKMAMGIALCNPRELEDGYEYKPMDQRTAVTLVEAAFNEPMIEGVDQAAWESFVDSLISRAGSVMEWNDETLMQVEADIKNIKTAAVPMVTEAVTPDGDANLKQAANLGNLQLTPKGVDGPINRTDKRDDIRRAVGTTRVASLNQGTK